MSAVKRNLTALIFVRNNAATTTDRFACAGVIEKCDWASQGLDRAEG
jgi:hypothetical protein